MSTEYSPPASGKNNVLLVVAIVMSVLAVCFLVCAGVLAALLLPAVGAARTAAQRAMMGNNMKQIGLAIMSYETKYGTYPPAYTVDAQGNRLHSWRTLILPFMEQNALYSQIDLNKPWNDPANSAAMNTFIEVYTRPGGDDLPGHTHVSAIVDASGIFRPSKSRKISEITDGTANTALLFDSDKAVHWMSPEDASLDEFVSICALGRAKQSSGGPTGHLVIFADGAVQYLPTGIAPETAKAIATADGNETVMLPR